MQSPRPDPAPAAWPRPVPAVGDRTSAAERSEDPAGWAFSDGERAALGRIMAGRRDVRRFRADPVPPDLLRQVLAAAHQAPSVGHSQPWRFVVVSDARTRVRAAVMADRARLAQAAVMAPDSARHLLDLDLEGIREAPLGVVVCCDRRVPAAGVLGRATFPDADMWSCACAIQNMWLAARAAGLGIGWVTLFEPDDLRALVGAPAGVETLGWLCLGWPDERPPDPGLERRGWSTRQPLEEVVLSERWPSADGPASPPSHLAAGGAGLAPAQVAREGEERGPAPVAAPTPGAVVAARDTGDALLSPPGSLGLLDRVVDRVLAVRPLGPGGRSAGRGRAGRPVLAPAALVLVASDHPVVCHGVSAYDPGVTRSVVEAAVAGVSVGVVAAGRAGMRVVVVDAGVSSGPVPGARSLRPDRPRGDLVGSDGLAPADVTRLVGDGADLARDLSRAGFGVIALGEIGVGNTAVAAALAAGLLGGDPDRLVGLGAGSDSAILAAKRRVVATAVERARRQAPRSGDDGDGPAGGLDARYALAALGGGEFAVLAGVVLGAATEGAVVVLDGMATAVAALAALHMEPAVAPHLVAGQRSRETGHGAVLAALGLEPLLDLRLRAGEGVGAALAVPVLEAAVAVRASAARTFVPRDRSQPGPV